MHVPYYVLKRTRVFWDQMILSRLLVKLENPIHGQISLLWQLTDRLSFLVFSLLFLISEEVRLGLLAQVAALRNYLRQFTGILVCKYLLNDVLGDSLDNIGAHEVVSSGGASV